MKKNAFSMMFLSYVSILAIIIVLMSAGHLYNNRLLTNQVLSTYSAALDTVQGKIDGKLRELFFSTNQIRTNATISTMARSGSVITPAVRVDFISVGKDLRSYQVSVGADDILLFFHAKDKVLHQRYVYSRKDLFSRFFPESGIPFDDWISLFSPVSSGGYCVLSHSSENQRTGPDYLYLMYPLRTEDPDTILALGFEKATLSSWLAEIPVSQGGRLLLVGKDGRILADSSHGAEEIFPNLKLFEGPAQTVQRFSDGRDSRIASYLPSQSMDWYYVFEMPSGLFWSPSRNLLAFSLTLSIISIGVILLMAYRFSKNHQTRLTAIMEHISALAPGRERDADEYAYISQMIDALEEEQQKNSSDRRSRQLYGLMSGQAGEQGFLDLFPSAYAPGRSLAVCCVSVADDSGFSPDHTGLQQELYLLWKLFDELYEGTSLRIDPCTPGDTVYLCLTWGEGFDPDLLAEDYLMQKYVEFLDQHFHLHVRLLMSSVYTEDMETGGLACLRAAYGECQALLASSWMLPEKCVAHPGDVEPGDNIYQYPLEYEQKLCHIIQAGDTGQAAGIVSNVLSQLDTLSADMALLLLFDVAATMAKAANTIPLREFLESCGLTEVLFQARSAQQKKEHLNEILCRLCEKAAQAGQDPRSAGYAAKINAYIDANYADASLNVTAIAEEFHLSSRHLSRVYREETGQILLNHLHQVRIDQAKRLLLERPEDKIADIALQAGYSDSGTFIRLFKKYVGVTPGDFRRLPHPEIS